MSASKKEYKRVTVKSLIEMKSLGEKISMLTAYDYTMAKIDLFFSKPFLDNSWTRIHELAPKPANI